MHDSGMTLFLFLLAFVANLAVGVYSLFLRSQIQDIREGKKQNDDLRDKVTRLTTLVESETAARQEAVDSHKEYRDKLDELTKRLGDATAKIASSASREAVQGIRGDLSTLTERMVGLQATITSGLEAMTKTLGSMERRVDRQDEFLQRHRLPISGGG